LAQQQELSRRAPDANHLRGLEGSAAALYFHGFGRLLEGDGFGFSVRSRRPPLTAFDALCGFGYGVLWNALLLRIELNGLDPYTGVYHVGSQRHAALVSDLIEPLRTFLVDQFHGQLIRAGLISAANHFEPHGGGIYLNDEGRRLWLSAWSAFMGESITMTDGSNGLRWEVLDQLVRSFARFVDDPESCLAVPLRR
jgi:CRISPR-associated protein Cas1